jgi:hypothetical protein
MLTRRSLLAVSAIVMPLPTVAHHGFTGRYDTDAPIWILGAVTAAAFSPPHPVLNVRVDIDAAAPQNLPVISSVTGAVAVRAADHGQVLAVELPPVGTFFGLSSQVRVGDRVAMIALRNCAPPHQLRSQWIRLANGSVIERAERMSYMVRGCA